MNAIRVAGALALAGMLAGCAAKTPFDTGAVPDLDKTPMAAVPDVPARVVAVPAPAPAPVMVPAPVAVPLPTVPVPQRMVEAVPAPVQVAAPAPEPVYETVVEAQPIVAAPVMQSEYRPVGALDAPVPAAPAPAPIPVYVEAFEAAPRGDADAIRAMAPIRDDPRDGRNARPTANDEVRQHARKGYRRNAALRAGGSKPLIRSNYTPAFGMELEQAALDRLNPSIRYDARYVKIGYPWGDVDETTGVCTDVVIRSYRTLGIDLQEMVHEDMKRAFKAYPSKRIYGLRKADPNIDHRRVVNLEAFFERTGSAVPVGTEPDDFKPGDVLTWRLSGHEPHIGIVVADRDPRTGFPLVVHNLGAGVRKDDLITLSDPVGHFRFAPDRQTVVAALVTKE